MPAIFLVQNANPSGCDVHIWHIQLTGIPRKDMTSSIYEGKVDLLIIMYKVIIKMETFTYGLYLEINSGGWYTMSV